MEKVRHIRPIPATEKISETQQLPATPEPPEESAGIGLDDPDCCLFLSMLPLAFAANPSMVASLIVVIWCAAIAYDLSPIAIKDTIVLRKAQEMHQELQK
jgi:hypothetical protein